MSAYVVGRAHIDALVRVALEGPSDRAPQYPGDGWTFDGFYNDEDGEQVRYDVDRLAADDLGRMLWIENVRSVAARYPEDDSDSRPGPADFTDTEAETYTYPRGPLSPRHLTAVEALVALSGYEYQACEHPEWEGSAARAFCDALRHAVIRALPGYDTADTWEVREPAVRGGER
jgi:hypothetical protein